MSGTSFNGKGFVSKSDATMESNTMDAAYHDSRFTAEISKRMQVPDRIAIGGQEMGAGDSQAGLTNLTRGSMNDNEQAASLKMQVPERILVAGGNSHVAAKNLPRELQFENSVLSPSPEQIIAPPSSIRLNEHPFPTVGQDSEIPNNILAMEKDSDPKPEKHHYGQGTAQKNAKVSIAGNEKDFLSNSLNSSNNQGANSSKTIQEENISLYKSERDDELKDARRQISKLNRRMIELEIENRELQQRELFMGVLVCGYMLKKLFSWMFRNN